MEFQPCPYCGRLYGVGRPLYQHLQSVCKGASKRRRACLRCGKQGERQWLCSHCRSVIHDQHLVSNIYYRSLAVRRQKPLFQESPPSFQELASTIRCVRLENGRPVLDEAGNPVWDEVRSRQEAQRWLADKLQELDHEIEGLRLQIKATQPRRGQGQSRLNDD